MIQSVPLNCSLSAFLAESNGSTRSPKSSSPTCAYICCSVSRNNAHIPKLEPFSRTKFDRGVKEPPLIQKSENQIADYCLTVEGDESYSCWKAYFELKDLEKESPKEDVERLIIESGGVKSLIDRVHGVASIHRSKMERSDSVKQINIIENTISTNPCPILDGLPKTLEELGEEEKALMPDSAFTRLLRARGKRPAWYSPAPEHETD